MAAATGARRLVGRRHRERADEDDEAPDRHALVVVAAGPAAAGDLISGPVPGAPTRVVDGDTMEVTATPWPDVSVRTSMRLLGLDTPELRGRRPSERTAAQAAARHQTQIVGGVERLHLVDIDTPAAPSGDCWPTVSTCHSP